MIIHLKFNDYLLKYSHWHLSDIWLSLLYISYISLKFQHSFQTVWGGGEYTYSIRICKLEARKFFLFNFKWPSSQDQQKTIVRRLITSKVTLTCQSHFMLIFVLRKATLPNRINSVPWMNAVTPTPYHECTQLVWIKVALRSRQTASIHGTELVWPLSFMLRS